MQEVTETYQDAHTSLVGLPQMPLQEPASGTACAAVREATALLGRRNPTPIKLQEPRPTQEKGPWEPGELLPSFTFHLGRANFKLASGHKIN